MSDKRRWTVDSYVIAIFLSALDISIVSPSLTVIASDLGFPVRGVIWVIALHLAVFVLALPLMERWGNLSGRQNWFAVSLSLFALGSLTAGVSNSWLTLIGGRVIQALGAGGVVPPLSVGLRRLIHHRRRPLGLVIHALFGGLFIIIPFLSSSITWHYGWRWIFLVNIPVAVVVYILSHRFSLSGSYRTPSYQTTGLFYFAAILLLAMIAVSQLNPEMGWRMLVDPRFLPFAVLAAGLMIPLMMVEHQAESPFFKPHLLIDPHLIGVHFAVMLAGCTWVAVVLVPGWMVAVFDQPQGTGGIFLSIVAGAAWFTLPISRRIFSRWEVQTGLALGFFFTAAAYFSLTLVQDLVSLATVLVILGVGLGFTLSSPVHELLFQTVSMRQIKSGLMMVAMFRATGWCHGTGDHRTFLF